MLLRSTKSHTEMGRLPFQVIVKRSFSSKPPTVDNSPLKTMGKLFGAGVIAYLWWWGYKWSQDPRPEKKSVEKNPQ